jgi:hypothetical protein
LASKVDLKSFIAPRSTASKNLLPGNLLLFEGGTYLALEAATLLKLTSLAAFDLSAKEAPSI